MRLRRIEGSGGRSPDNLGAKSLQSVDLLGAHLFREDDDATVALDDGRKSQTNTCVNIYIFFNKYSVFREIGSGQLIFQYLTRVS